MNLGRRGITAITALTLALLTACGSDTERADTTSGSATTATTTSSTPFTPTTSPTTTITSTTVERTATGLWMSKGARLTLDADGTGVFHFNSGASNSATWSLRWTQSSATTVTLRFGAQTATQGSDVSPKLRSGDTVIGEISGYRMRMVDVPTDSSPYDIYVCTSDHDRCMPS